MAYSEKYVSSQELTGIARAAFQATYELFPLARYLPVKETPSRMFTFTQTVAAAPQVASKLTQWNTTAPRGDQYAVGATISGRVVRTSEASVVDEALLVTSPTADQLAQWMRDRAMSLGQRAGNRARLMAAEVIQTGKVALDEANSKQVIDFGRPTTHSVTLSSSKLWSAQGATPVGDVKAWRELTGSSNLFVSRETLILLQRNTDLIKRALRRGSDLVDEISEAEVRQVFAGEGFDLNILDRTVNDITTYEGEAAQLVPADHVFLMPQIPDTVLSVGVGELLLAPTVESENATYGVSAGERPGVWAAAFHEDDPEGWRVRMSAELLTVLTSPASFVTAKVK